MKVTNKYEINIKPKHKLNQQHQRREKKNKHEIRREEKEKLRLD